MLKSKINVTPTLTLFDDATYRCIYGDPDCINACTCMCSSNVDYMKLGTMLVICSNFMLISAQKLAQSNPTHPSDLLVDE